MNMITAISAKTKILNSLRGEREPWIVWLMALAIYLPGIWWGLPHATHPLGVHGWDIDAVTGIQTMSELHNLFVQPKADWYLAYPVLHYIIVGMCYVPYLVVLYLTGGISQPSPQYPFGLADPVSALKILALIGRTITVLMASGIVVSAYLTARTVWDTQAARLTAPAVALPTTMIFYAKTGNLDVPVLFWMSLTILVLATSLTRGLTIRRSICLGIFAALAVATKDQAYGALTVGLLMLVVVHLREGTPNTETTARWKAPLLLFVSGLIAYICFSGLWISPYRFFGHIQFVRNFDKTFYNVVHLNLLRPATLEGYLILSLDIARELLVAVGPILLIVGLTGVAILRRSSVFANVLLLMVLGHIVLVIFPVRHMQFRYILFPAFVLAFFIAQAFQTGLRQKRKWLSVGTLIVMVLCFGWLSLRAVDLTYQMVFDARYEAGRWLEQNTNSGDKIAFSTDKNLLPRLKRDVIAVPLIHNPLPSETLQKEKIRFVVVQRDYSNKIGDEHSQFFSRTLYQQINDGELGYQRVTVFETKPLFQWLYPNLPLISQMYIVNAPVTIYERR